MSSKFCRSRRLGLLLVCVATSPAGWAAGFAAGIAPSKFELRAKPGQVLRDTITIVNPTGEDADYLFRTADWRLDDNSNVQFVEQDLLDDSCRPWVRLERRTVSLVAGAQKVYRFEVHVPEDAPSQLCRFAILIEPAEAYGASIGDGSISVPIVGRYAVITYVTIGDAAADVEYLGVGVTAGNGQRLPTLRLRNFGTAHDRAFGQVTATDSLGRRVSLTPSNFPVLPGRSEAVPLLPEIASGAAPISLEYPLALDGRIEVSGRIIDIDEVVE